MTEYTEPILMETRSSSHKRRKSVGLMVALWTLINSPLMLTAGLLEAVLQDISFLRGNVLYFFALVVVFLQEALCFPALVGLVVLRFFVGVNREL